MSITVSKLDRTAPRTISIGGPGIDSKAPTSPPEAQAAPTPQVEGQEAPTGQPDANQGQSKAESDPRLEELARKERLIRAEALRLKAEKDAWQKAQAPQQQGMTAEEWKKAFLEDPSKVGLDYQAIADRYLNQPSEDEQKYKAFEQKIAELEARLSNQSQNLEQAQAQAYENAMKQLKSDTQALIGRKPDEYEALAAEGATDAVVELIKSTYHEEGILMSVEDAARKVEDYLTERALKLAGLKKVRAKVDTTAQATPAITEQKTQGQQQIQVRTTSLSHSMQPATKPLTAAERRERAIKAFRGEKL